jgi:hypothetical protein
MRGLDYDLGARSVRAADARCGAVLTQYLDTPVLLAALTNERETARMQNWLAQQTQGDLVVSEWVATEFSAALSVKLRTGQPSA